jgi:glucose-1-phosphate thymidylyltransferase
MIGIYYFKDATKLKFELDYLIENNVIKSGEYQLPDALRNLTEKGHQFKPGKVIEWLDCGNKEATVYTNQRVLEFDKAEQLISANLVSINSVVIPPCYIGEDVVLENAIVGPHVSLGKGTKITNTVISNSIIQTNVMITNAVIKDSMIGNSAKVLRKDTSLSIGDYTEME